MSYKTPADKGKHISMVAHKKKGDIASKLKATDYEIEIKDEETDLEITIEGSDHFYGSTIVVIPEDHADSSQFSSDSDRGMGSLIGRVLGSREALEPE